MDCPSKEILQDFMDGELPEAKNQPIIEHIRSCDTCKTELREVFSLHRALNQVVDRDRCPSLETLENYADNTCASEEMGKIKEHIDFCGRCRSYVWAFQASEEELADWQKQDDLAYQEFEAQNLGYDSAKETLQQLLPSKMELLDNAWQSVRAFALDLKEKAIESWPSFDRGPRLVEALGFAEPYDPETDTAFVILVTSLYISHAVSDGHIKPSPKEMEPAIKEVSEKLGAGRELQKRLIEIVPPLVLKFR